MMYETLIDLLPAYALGILNPEEQTAVETGLTQYPELRKELERYQATVDQLAMLSPQIMPPADLGDRLIQRLERESSSARIITPQFNTRRWVLAAASIIMLIFAVILWQLTQGDAPEDQIAAILEDSDSTTVEITGSEGYDALTGAFVIASDHHAAVLQLENLTVLPPDRTYQLWMARGEDDRISPLLFRPDESEATLLVTLPSDFETYRLIGVTVEPAGGSEGPTSPAVFFAALPE